MRPRIARQGQTQARLSTAHDRCSTAASIALRNLRKRCCRCPTGAVAEPLKKKVGFREAGNIDLETVPQLKDDCILFYHPSCRELAGKVADCSDTVQLGEISWSCASASFSRPACSCMSLVRRLGSDTCD